MATVKKVTFGILTVSDRCYAKTAEDKSGNELKRILEEGVVLCNAVVVWTGVVPDDIALIQGLVKHCCDVIGVNVLIITGGTGLAPRDVTPDALQDCIDREVPGMGLLILQEGLKKTPHAALSRSMVGVRGTTLIASLPGSTRGSVESLQAIAPVIPHAVDLIGDDKEKVAVTHNGVIPDALLVKSKVVVATEDKRVRESPYPLLPMSELPGLFKKFISTLGTQIIRSADAVGYFLAEDVVSDENVPQVRTSMKDGYALGVRYFDQFIIIGESLPGGKCVCVNGEEMKEFCLTDGQAVIVSTGSPVPKGTYCVLPIELTTAVNSEHKFNLKSNIYYPEENRDIREIGSDVSIGQVVLERDTFITESEVGTLAAVGKAEISVIRKPVVAVLSSGDELQEPWEPLKPHGVRDSNKIVLKSLLSSWGYRVIDLGIVNDEPDAVLNVLTNGFDLADVVISTGGMSMGQRDIIKDVLIQDLGVKIHFGRLNMKPGKPTGFGTLIDGNRKKYWFGLPGNPASAFVTAHLVVLPVLKMISGWKSNVLHRKITAIAGHDINFTDAERIEYQRGFISYVDNAGAHLKMPLFFTTGESKQRSSNIVGCSRATCLVEIQPGKNIAKGSEILIVALE